MTPHLKPLALLVAALFALPASAQETKKDERTDVGTISITGEGDMLGAGQIIQEESPKSRSTTTKAAIDKLRPTSNPYQAIQMLPGVNTFSHDSTGMFGGGLRVRSFNSDQLGFTIDGAPVNDSGSFAVFPQEYTDQENVCEIFLTQGSADNEAPHVGASGGNVGMVTCDPAEKMQVRLQETLGQLSLVKTFARIDSGRLDVANGLRTFLSYSKANVDKWKGAGEADRKHLDFKSVMDLSGGSRLSVAALLNEAINNNYRTGSKVQFANDYHFDYSSTFTPNPAGGPGRQVAPTQDTYYNLSLNPFRNALLTAKANINVTPAIRVDVEPYYWYGYGHGGTQQVTLNEGGTFRGGIEDMNRDGDRLDNVLIFRSSVTRTYRPGATVKFNWVAGNNRITAGYWFERARHYQTAPATRIDANAQPDDLWLEGSYILRADGTPYNNRDQLTVSRASSPFIQDSMTFLNDKLVVQLGVKRPSINRDYRNYANEGFGQQFDYGVNQTFEKALPSAGVKYQITDAHQVFANIAENFKAPGNFSYQSAIVNGVNRIDQIAATLRAETSTNMDVGYRYFGKDFTFSGSLFSANFKDRLSRQYDPVDSLTKDTNVGDATTRGVEVEAGTKPWAGFTLYGSASYTKTRMKQDLQVSATNLQPTAGKEFADTPNWLLGLSLQYAQGPVYAVLATKYTGARYTSLVNDDAVPGYTLVDFNAGYRFASVAFLRNPTVRFSVSNLFDKRYLALNAGSGSLFVTNTTGTGASTVFFYAGAPRFSSVALSAEF